MNRRAVIGGSIAGLVVIAAATPYLVGMQAERSLRADHEILAQEVLLPGLAITLDDYQRGYLGAEALTAITFTPSATDAEPIRLEIRHHISHLPNLRHLAVATARSELVLPAELQKEADQFLKGQSPLTITTHIGITGAQTAELNSPTFKTTLENKATTLEWKGIQGSGTKSGDSNEITNDVVMPGIIVSSADSGFALNDIRYTTEMERGSYDLWFGITDATMKSLQYNANDAGGTHTIALNDLHMRSELHERGEVSDNTVLLQFGKSNFDDVTLESAVYDLEFRSIDTKTLSELQTAMRQAYSGGDEALLGAAFLGAVPSLLKAKPELNIRRLDIASSAGNFTGKLHLAFAGEWSDEMMNNPMAILSMLNADVDLTISKTLLVSLGQSQMRNSIAAMAEMQGEELSSEEIDAMAKERAAQQLEVLAANEYLLEKGDLYVTKIHFEKGQLTINGKAANELFGSPAR